MGASPVIGRRAAVFNEEPVGSLPRPAKLQAAYADYDAGDISREQRWSSFATYPLAEREHGASVNGGAEGRAARPPW